MDFGDHQSLEDLTRDLALITGEVTLEAEVWIDPGQGGLARLAGPGQENQPRAGKRPELLAKEAEALQIRPHGGRFYRKFDRQKFELQAG